VQQQCLDYSIKVEEGHGIWGGLNELERKRLLRRMRAQAAEQQSPTEQSVETA
jgi:hypothetical protein